MREIERGSSNCRAFGIYRAVVECRMYAKKREDQQCARQLIVSKDSLNFS